MSKLVRDSVLYTAGAVLIRSMGIVLIPLYTNYFSVEQYGVLAILTIYLQLFSTVFLFGVNSATTRLYFSDCTDVSAQRKLYGTAFLLFLFLPMLSVGLLTPVMQVLANRVYKIHFVPFFAVILLTGALKPIEKLATGLLRVQKRALTFVAFYFAEFFIQFLAICVFVVPLKMGVTGQIYGQLFASALFFFVAIAMLLPHIDIKFDIQVALKILRFGLPLVPFFIFSWLIASSPRILMERFGSFESLGIFSLAAQFSGILLLIGNAADNALVPFYYESANSHQAEIRLGNLATKFVGVSSLVALGIVGFAAPFLRAFVKPQFLPAVPYVAPLVFATYLGLLYRVFHWNLMSQKKTQLTSLLTGFSFLLLVLGAFASLKFARSPINAIVVAMIFSQFTTLVVAFFVSQRVFAIRYDRRKLPLIGVTFLVSAAFMLIGQSRFLGCVGIAYSGTLMLIATLMLARIVEMDLTELVSTLPFRQYQRK